MSSNQCILHFLNCTFYLVGVNDKEQVLIFRIDRIQEYKVLNTKFNVPNSPYIREGALKQRIYFMYGWPLEESTL